MACGCQKVCIKGDISIDTDTPLNVNIVNTAPIAVTGDQGAPIAVFGVEGAPVAVAIIEDPITAVPDGFEFTDDNWSSPAGAKSISYLTLTGTDVVNNVEIALPTAGWVETAADKSWQWSVDDPKATYAAGAIVITATGTGAVRVSWTT